MDTIISEDEPEEAAANIEDFLQRIQSRRAGPPIEQIAQAMTDDGFARGHARSLAAAARIRYGGHDIHSVARTGPLREAIEAMALAAREAMVATADRAQPQGLCEPTALRANRVNVGGHCVEVRLASRGPRMALFGHFASAQECDAMIQLAKQRPEPSGYITEHGDETQEDARRRAVHGRYYDFFRPFEGVIDTLIHRAATLLGWPEAWIGPLQILHYPARVNSRHHFDWRDVSTEAGRRYVQREGQVVATMVLYLNDVRSGGATSFAARGLRVHAHRGDASFFISQRDDGRFDPANLHREEPVSTGEKWAATLWCRDRACTR